MPTYVVKADRWRRVQYKDNKMVKSDRLYRGDTVELSEDEAKVLVKQGGLVLQSEDTKQEETPPEVPADAETTGGTSGDSDTSEVTEGQDESSPDATDEEQADEEATDYSVFTYAELQQEAKSRGLNGGGNFADLVARLQAHDKSDEQ